VAIWVNRNRTFTSYPTAEIEYRSDGHAEHF
jgi:hypothetical protein